MVFQHFLSSDPFCNSIQPIDPFRNFPVRHRKCIFVFVCTTNLELCKIDHWLRANKLSLNYNKTNFMLLTSRKHNPASFKVTINNHTISSEDNLKYLGVLLDNKLSCKPHVQKVKTQLSRACGILSKLKQIYIITCTEGCL